MECNLGYVNYFGIQIALKSWDAYPFLKMEGILLRVLVSSKIWWSDVKISVVIVN